MQTCSSQQLKISPHFSCPFGFTYDDQKYDQKEDRLLMIVQLTIFSVEVYIPLTMFSICKNIQFLKCLRRTNKNKGSRQQKYINFGCCWNRGGGSVRTMRASDHIDSCPYPPQ